MGRVHGPPGSHPASHDVTQVLLMEREDTAGQQRGIHRIAAVGCDWNSKIREARSHNCAQVSAPIHTDLHTVSVRRTSQDESGECGASSILDSYIRID